MDHPTFNKILESIAKNGGFDGIKPLLNRLSREQTYGSKDSAFADAIHGFNRRPQGNMLPANSDQQGLTFFTRPNLNLAYDNISRIRSLTPLLTTKEQTLQRAVRCMLDRQLKLSAPGIFDNHQTFMPFLSNSMISISGWPDINMNVYSSTEGVAKESWIMTDSIADINNRFTLTATFQNTLGDPITLIFHTWLVYMGGVYTGKLDPHMEDIRYNEMDYTTRIYRLIMDRSGQFVQKVAACGYAVPSAISIGGSFYYSRDAVYNEELNQITVPFECVGAMYNDPILLKEFNMSVEMGHAEMGDATRELRFTRVPRSEEHTSELQSRENLVCRLLLEKKKT